jgi:hypothetical protein
MFSNRFWLTMGMAGIVGLLGSLLFFLIVPDILLAVPILYFFVTPMILSNEAEKRAIATLQAYEEGTLEGDIDGQREEAEAFFEKEGKLRWYFPLFAFLVPGSCYALATFMPHFDLSYAIVGIILTTLAFIWMIARVIDPDLLGSVIFRFLGFHALFLGTFALAMRLWIVTFPDLKGLIIFVSVASYVLAWAVPYIFPVFTKSVYKEIWYPKTWPMRTCAGIALGIGGAAGVVGAIIGKEISQTLGDDSLWFLALIASLLLLGSSMYASTLIWRMQNELPEIPSAE